MEKIPSIILVVALFLIAREGFQQRDRVDPSNPVSKTWHAFGWFMRLLITGVAYQSTGSYLYVLLFVVLFWPVYNISCNIGAKRKWYYVSKSGIDGLIRKMFYKINFDQ